MQAVAIPIRLGKRVMATFRELRNPTKTALKSWYLEEERPQNLSKASAPRSPKFSEERRKSPWRIMPAKGAALCFGHSGQ